MKAELVSDHTVIEAEHEVHEVDYCPGEAPLGCEGVVISIYEGGRDEIVAEAAYLC